MYGSDYGVDGYGSHLANAVTPRPAAALAEISLVSLESAAELYRLRRDTAALAQLRAARLVLADFILACTPDEAQRCWTAPLAVSPLVALPFGEVHAVLMGAGLRELPRSPDDNACLVRLRAAMSGGASGHQPGGVEQGAMAAMLFAFAHEMPPAADLAQVADWFRGDYVAWLMSMPGLFLRAGEADAYGAYLRHAVARVHNYVTQRPAHGGAVQVAAIFAGAGNFVQSYFNAGNLRDMQAQRGDIIARALLDEGRALLSAPAPRSPGGKIRLGILARHYSPQTDIYFLISHFEHLDRKRFDVTLFALEATGHALEKHCFGAADRAVLLPPRDLDAQAARIRAADLDILLFGNNLAAVVNAEAALGAHRLARIQVASVSTPVTTGLAHMDVMLSADWNEPPQRPGTHYTEHLVRMQGGLGCYAFQYDRDPATTAIGRAGLGLGEGQTVFFSGANFYKIVPELVESWTRILAAVPDSALLLMPFNPSWSGEYQTNPFMERIGAQIEGGGVARRRVKVLAPVPSRADLQRVLALADVYLDAYPFAGACSMLDPLQAGVPPVAWYGNTARSRHGSALLQSVGLAHLATDSAAAYEEKAVQLARDPISRQRIRDRLLQLQRCDAPPPYLDTRAFSAKVGDALDGLFQEYMRRADRLRKMDGAALRLRGMELAAQLVGTHAALDKLGDEWIVRHLALPYLQSLDRGGRAPLLIDVGACYGALSMPFLAVGWSAVLFEPDPDARQVLEANLAPHLDRCRIVPAAVDRSPRDAISFFKNDTAGLSGLSASPYGETGQVIEVPAIRLSDYCREAGLEAVDFLKIDAEGHDFDALEGFDFTALQPSLVMVEFGTQFARQTLADVAAAMQRMRDLGYGALVFSYTDDGAFSTGVWSYRLIGLDVDGAAIDLDIARGRAASGGAMFGNILFYRDDDKRLLLMLIELLESCLPRDRFRAGLPEEGVVS